LASGAAFRRQPLPRAKPEDVGLSKRALARIGRRHLKADIEAGRIPGAVIASPGPELLLSTPILKRQGGLRARPRIPSSHRIDTKPMTNGRALMLYESARILIDDPLAKIFSEILSMRGAARERSEPTPNLAAKSPDHDPDLMRPTSYWSYGGRCNTLVHKMYPAHRRFGLREY